MLAIVKVSLPPLFPSVKEIPVLATSLPIRKPAVVSLLDTLTKESVSADIATQALPL